MKLSSIHIFTTERYSNILGKVIERNKILFVMHVMLKNKIFKHKRTILIKHKHLKILLLDLIDERQPDSLFMIFFFFFNNHLLCCFVGIFYYFILVFFNLYGFITFLVVCCQWIVTKHLISNIYTKNSYIFILKKCFDWILQRQSCGNVYFFSLFKTLYIRIKI